MPLRWTPLVILAVQCVAACDPVAPSAVATAPVSMSASIFLASPITDPAPGTDAVVVAQFRAVAPTLLAASFTTEVTYDPAAVAFVTESSADDALRAVNAATPGMVRLAGARAGGFVTGQLFQARFHVLRRGGLASLQLRVTQISTSIFAELSSTISVGNGVRWVGR